MKGEREEATQTRAEHFDIATHLRAVDDVVARPHHSQHNSTDKAHAHANTDNHLDLIDSHAQLA